MTEQNNQNDTHTETVEDVAFLLETSLAEHKAFKKQAHVKAIFEENREFNKRAKQLKDQLRALMKESGVTTTIVGGMEIELKPSTKEKHDPALLEDAMGNDKFTEYLSKVSVQDDKVVTRKAPKRARAADA